MCTKQIILVLGIVLSLLDQSATAAEIAATSSVILVDHLTETPQSLSAQLKKSLAKVRPACVGINIGGSASGVIISPDGHVLTVAHIARKYKPGKPLEVILHNGRVLQAKLLGFNRETDYALLKITTPAEEPWPCCEIAEMAPTTGAFCFTAAHPSGYLKGRPAQVRLGRITTHTLRRDKPFLLIADCNIQPGDSGGPLFSLAGKLIGLDSSAANLLEFNIFPAIDQWHLDKSRLYKGDRWGAIEKAPDGGMFANVSVSPESWPAVQAEFMRRLQIEYPPTVDLILELVDDTGKVEIDQSKIINHMARDAIAISRNQPISLGLDDPKLVITLPQLPAESIRPLALHADNELAGYAIAIDAHHLITKASRIDGGKAISLYLNGENLPLKRVATDEHWDLAIFKLDDPQPLAAIPWPESTSPVEAGDLLIAHDHRSRMLWNIAMDEARVVAKKRSTGPLPDKSIISRHRAPYPLAIRHALPLYAKDAGKPVFNENGQFIGMHIARFSRTIGLIIPLEQLKRQADQMMDGIK